MTFVGAFGSEYVAPCAVGVTNETSNDVARAIEPQLKNLRAVRVLFIGASYEIKISNHYFFDYETVAPG